MDFYCVLSIQAVCVIKTCICPSLQGRREESQEALGASGTGFIVAERMQRHKSYVVSMILCLWPQMAHPRADLGC